MDDPSLTEGYLFVVEGPGSLGLHIIPVGTSCVGMLLGDLVVPIRTVPPQRLPGVSVAWAGDQYVVCGDPEDQNPSTGAWGPGALVAVHGVHDAQHACTTCGYDRRWACCTACGLEESTP